MQVANFLRRQFRDSVGRSGVSNRSPNKEL